MSKLVRFKDTRSQCWSRVDMPNNDPIYISIAQTGIVVKKSNMGILGPKLFVENDLSKIGAVCQNLDITTYQYNTPDNMTHPVLRLFTQVALNASSVAELTTTLGEARE